MTQDAREVEQLSLFGLGGAEPGVVRGRARSTGRDIQPALVSRDVARLAAGLDPHIRLGTSSWSFPGWAGLVYAHAASESDLARRGLVAYARHPLFRTVGIDKTYYAPMSEPDYAAMAADVPDGFRFLVKAHQVITLPYRQMRTGRAGEKSARTTTHRFEPNPNFLDPVYATEAVISPTVAGLGAKCGPIVFQFSPMNLAPRGRRATPDDAKRLLDRLARFLDALPVGLLYAVELRNSELLTPEYAAILRAANIAHCFNVHPAMPSPEEQRGVIDAGAQPAIVVRWMLNPSQTFESGGAAYAPFNRIVDADPANRAAIARLAAGAAARGREVWVIANNNAEGSSPQTLIALAREIEGLQVNPSG